jgi:PAS domain S-box-containing protein
MESSQQAHDVTLLYVEDEESTLEYLSLMLRDRFNNLICARDGLEGLQLFQQYSPDIVITDIIMPNMDGISMSRKIRELSADVQLIALTALSDSENLLEAIDAGINKFIVKPVILKNLNAVIEGCVDIVKMKRDLKAQNERIKLLSSALEQSPNMVVITDTNGIIEQVNHKFIEVTGYSAEEVIGKTPRILNSGETSHEVYESIWSTLLDGRSWHGVLQNRRKGGELYWEYSSISPIVLDGNRVKFIKTAEDITELRKTEDEAIRLKQQESVSTMAAGIAHDFNNLLQVISGNIMLAKHHSAPDSKTYQHLATAETSVRQAAELSRKMRSLTRRDGVVMQPAPLASLVLTTAKATLKGTPVNLVENVQHDLDNVKFNVSQMQLVITMITTNAAEAMPSGGSLEISITNCTIDEINQMQLPPGRYVHLVLADSGTGISAENLPKIFNPYFTTKELGVRKGIGLSLANCHSIIRNHQGAITAESEPGKGCRINIYLPAATP